jgi:hypothetical protein
MSLIFVDDGSGKTLGWIYAKSGETISTISRVKTEPPSTEILMSLTQEDLKNIAKRGGQVPRSKDGRKEMAELIIASWQNILLEQFEEKPEETRKIDLVHQALTLGIKNLHRKNSKTGKINKVLIFDASVAEIEKAITS